jgi:hypothetical protein
VTRQFIETNGNGNPVMPKVNWHQIRIACPAFFSIEIVTLNMENIYFNKLGLQTLSLNFALNGKQSVHKFNTMNSLLPCCANFSSPARLPSISDPDV